MVYLRMALPGSYTFKPIDRCSMCGDRTAGHRVLGRRLNKKQGRDPRKLKGVCVTIMRCTSCGLVYSDPQPVPMSIDDHYGVPPESYWDPSYFEVPPDYFSREVNISRELLGNGPLRALDIGAGLGYAMVQLEKAGYETHGLEPSAPFRDRAISQIGVDPHRLRLGTVEDADYPVASFDFINLCVVLEHISDPGAALARAMTWLKPGGVIHVEVPSADWMIVRLTNLYYRLRRTDCVGNLSPMHPPYHLHEFTVACFREHGRRNGYSVERKAHYVCTTYLPKFIDVVARPLMAWTGTGMEVAVWLRKDGNGTNGQAQPIGESVPSGPKPLSAASIQTATQAGPLHVPGTPRSCPQCSSDKKIPYTPLSPHHLVKCGSCGLVYTALEPSNADLLAFYSRYLTVEDVSAVTMQRYEEVLDSFEPFRKNGRILETGCGSGIFMQRAALRGWQVHGTEIGEHALTAARSRGVDMIEGSLDRKNYPAEHFDIVCSIEVIEHLLKPRPELQNVVSVLRPGGLFYVTTPNFNCIARRVSPSDWNVASYPEHLTYFTPRTLHRMLASEGLEKRALTTTGFSVYRWQVRHDRSAVNKSAAQRKEESIRSALENKPHLRLLKRVTNALLNLFRLGDSMKAYYVKPARPGNHDPINTQRAQGT